MKTTFFTLLYSFAAVYTLWLFYLAVMSLKRARDAGTLRPVARAFGTPVLLLGLLIDFLVNVTVMSFLLLELPRERTVTARLTRHCCADSWRGRFSHWFCTELLDAFDPSGRHCD